MKRADFNKKWEKEIQKVAEANKVDAAVGSDMFISNIKNAFRVCYENAGKLTIAEKYKGLPDDFKYHQAAQDYLEVLKG